MRTIIWTVPLLLLMLTEGFAQSKDGIVRGVVRDEKKAMLPGVRIVVSAPDGKTTYRTTSDEAGEFKIDLPAGTYDVRAELSGFAAVTVSKVSIKESESIRLEPFVLIIDKSSPGVPVNRGVMPIPLAPIPESPSNRL